MDRRRFLQSGLTLAAAGSLAPLWTIGCATRPAPVPVNDIHSGLNGATVRGIVQPGSVDELAELIRGLPAGASTAVCGGRHAMGGQQFLDGGWLLDMRSMNRVLALDEASGIVEVGSGIQWPELIATLNAQQSRWGIVQKQTGADRLSIGGAVAANIHGRGLTVPPFIGDLESFTLVGPDGEVHTCSRGENAELFALAVGGYGLFGVVATARVRLMPRVKVRRTVELADVDELAEKVARRVAEGFLFGDGQFAIDPESPDFLKRCVFSTYQPVPDDTEIPPTQARLAVADWRRLLLMTHTDKSGAFDAYSRYYLSTDGQVYWSDTHQLSTYIDDYHAFVEDATGAGRGSEMISEVYVPRARLGELMERLRDDFRRHGVDVIYGTVRFIERDGESFLAWAREPFACVVLNFHLSHTAAGLEKAERDFQRLIDRALDLGGSYFLTYHRWARRDQVERAYPQLSAFLARKRAWDPDGRFQSDWYRHYQRMFA